MAFKRKAPEPEPDPPAVKQPPEPPAQRPRKYDVLLYLNSGKLHSLRTEFTTPSEIKAYVEHIQANGYSDFLGETNAKTGHTTVMSVKKILPTSIASIEIRLVP